MKEKKVLIQSSTGSNLHSILYLHGEESKNERIVIICHGFTGDKYEWGRFPKLAKSLNKEKIDALIFDFTGSGENERVPITLSKQIQDIESVYNWVRNKGYEGIAVLGLSLGGRTLLGADLPGIKAYIFWAPFFFLHSSDDQTDWFKDIDKGPVKIPSSGDVEPIIIDLSFVSDFAKFQVKPSLKKLYSPTLIVQGTSDESVPLEHTRKAFQLLPKNENHKLIEIQSATHDFEGVHLVEFITNTVKWLKNYL
ncbi:MAG: alpha/beta hydrolase [Promethearchaeota archaeon]